MSARQRVRSLKFVSIFGKIGAGVAAGGSGRESFEVALPAGAVMICDRRWLEQSDEHTVVWRTESFPRHWVGTSVRWDAEPREGGSTMSFRHAGFSDDEEAGRVGYT